MAQSNPSGGEVPRLINLIPVGLKEAAIDSPTSRATVHHYCDQIDLLEKWLEEYMKATNRLVVESTTLENVLSYFTSHAILPTTISEAMLDHDYSVLAMKKYAEGGRDFWMSMVAVVKKLTPLVVEPIRHFLHNELRPLKDARRNVESTMKHFDILQMKYAGLGKSKEPSSLREDAFQLHEARKAYLKATMDFFSIAPQFRFALDKLLVKMFFDQWREMRTVRENSAAVFQRTAGDMERVKGWMSEMESSEKSFKRELLTARKQLEEAAEAGMRPSRELEDYSVSTVPQYGGHAHTASGVALQKSPKKPITRTAEKQGWLFLRTYVGKPTRTVWIRRWAFLRNGVFGWLLQGNKAGGVEETERIGVLLCNIRPAPTEERRFCFELKTNKNTIVMQAETQHELVDWIAAFETAKSKALEEPGSAGGHAYASRTHADPAFAISAPPVPEFGTLILSSTEPGASIDESLSTVDRTSTLPVAGDTLKDPSIDLPRRATGADEGGTRDRIISRLDIHRKGSAMPPGSQSPASPSPAGGIASLIAASHGSMPVGPSIPMVIKHQPVVERPKSTFALALRDMPPSTLAPSTLANVPAPTNLSKMAIIAAGEKGLSGATDRTGIPNGLLANMWGSSYTGFVNRLERSDLKVVPDSRLGYQPSPLLVPSGSPMKSVSPKRNTTLNSAAISQLDLGPPQSALRSRSTSPAKRQRNTISFDEESAKKVRAELAISDFPAQYPLQLKTQDAQFRLLFPTVRRDERLVMVFRATWNPNEQQDFPGRIYVTPKDIYFYSNHLGMVLTSTVALSSVDEATAAPGRECDFLFLHLKEGSGTGSPTRITIKTFLEPLKLVQKRLNFLAKNSTAEEPLRLPDIIKVLLKMETQSPDRSPSLESWEEVPTDTPADVVAARFRARGPSTVNDLKSPIRVDRSYHMSVSASGARTAKFKLPAHPVKYTPHGNLRLATEREFDVSPKTLFHVMFGDRSVLWQLLQHERQARNLKQGPWINLGEGQLRRDFQFEIPSTNTLGSQIVHLVRDYQVVDVNSEHLCYVITDKRTPWYLPHQNSHRLVSKIVITHVAKGKCKLAVFIRVEWLKPAWYLKGVVERQGLHDLELDSLDLADLVADQVRKLGAHSRTKKAVEIFGQVGHSTDITQLEMDASAHTIETRRKPTRHSVVGLLMQSAFSGAESAAGIALGTLLRAMQWLAKTVSANKLILAVLLLSMLYNTWHTSRDTMQWWQERRAGNFLFRIGVSPNAVMSKSIYLSDLNEALSGTGYLPARDASSCYAVFHDEHFLDDVNAPLPSLKSNTNIGSSGVQRRTDLESLQRVQQTRHRLGSYRHDLLVAMRVVNSVEKEMLLAEWEDWLARETRRCKQVNGLIGKENGNQTTISGRGGSDGVVDWYNEYCVSCADEAGKIGRLDRSNTIKSKNVR